jgi:hypothetical protein
MLDEQTPGTGEQTLGEQVPGTGERTLDEQVPETDECRDGRELVMGEHRRRASAAVGQVEGMLGEQAPVSPCSPDCLECEGLRCVCV